MSIESYMVPGEDEGGGGVVIASKSSSAVYLGSILGDSNTTTPKWPQEVRGKQRTARGRQPRTGND